jgi:EAL domain-containing protein (putative c-di-GMP-specific phosphodiesterase class I)
VIKALKKQELKLEFQPQVDSTDNSVVGLEALLRWYSPSLGIIDPFAIFSVLESSESEILVDNWVIQSVCEQYKTWQKERAVTVPIAINLSAYHLAHDCLHRTIISTLEQYDLKPNCIEIEITEITPIHDKRKVIHALEELREIGIKIAIDDFGSEYCTLSYIKDLPIDIVKIDKSFIDDIGCNVKSEAIIESTVALLLGFGMLPIAEGVESKRQVDFLSAIGCTTIQGFYYYKPMKAFEIGHILALQSSSKEEIESSSLV